MRQLRLGWQTRGLAIERIAGALVWPASVIEEIEAGEGLPARAELQLMCRWYGLNVRAVFLPPKPRLVSTTIIGAPNSASP